MGYPDDATLEEAHGWSPDRPGIGELLAASHHPRPTVVCLCGSTKFKDAFEVAAREEALEGRITVTVGFFGHSDPMAAHMFETFPDIKPRLDELHLRKIEMADEVLILNVGGYIGESTARELAHARSLGRRVRFLEAEPHL